MSSPPTGFLNDSLHQVNDEFYSPYRGWSANVYTGPFNSTDLPNINEMVHKLQLMVGGDLVSVTSWWSEFKIWLGNKDKEWANMSSTNFSSDLANFLHSVRGARFARDFRFDSNLDFHKISNYLKNSGLTATWIATGRLHLFSPPGFVFSW